MIERQQLIDTVTSALAELPHVTHLETRKATIRPRCAVELNARIQGRPVHLLLHVTKATNPRDIREAIWRLRQPSTESGELPTVPLLISPALSESSKKLLRAEGIGYCDRGGSLDLEVPWAYYHVDRPPLSEKRSLPVNFYLGRHAQILQVLLSAPGQEWHINALADAASAALSTTHALLSYLEQELWVVRRGLGPSAIRILVEPGALLDAWAQRHSLTIYKPHSYYRFAPTAHRLRTELGSILDDHGVGYALTLESGAELTAPFLTHVDRLSVLIPDESPVANIALAAGLAPAEDGPNVTLFLCRSQGPLMFRRQVEDIWVANDVQLYLDLFASPGRAREQAAHLRRERIKF